LLLLVVMSIPNLPTLDEDMSLLLLAKQTEQVPVVTIPVAAIELMSAQNRLLKDALRRRDEQFTEALQLAGEMANAVSTQARSTSGIALSSAAVAGGLVITLLALMNPPLAAALLSAAAKLAGAKAATATVVAKAAAATVVA
jgi:hypothetical protein